MIEDQHPIGTGFFAASTAADVLAGLDLTGKNIVVTGAGAGLGRETARALAAAGAHVTAAVRNAKDTPLDLLDPDSIDAFAARYRETGRPLHVLIANAGVASRDRRVDARGYERSFATGHLGHFQLALGLLPALRAAHGARVVVVSSGAHRMSDIHWDDVHLTQGYSGNIAYAQVKRANVLFAAELDRRWSADGVRGFALHPGISVATSLAHLDEGLFTLDELRAMELIDEAGEPIIDPDREKKTPEQAAATIAFAASSPLLDGIGGVYLKNSDVAVLDGGPSLTTVGDRPVLSTDAHPDAFDPESGRRLWELSEDLIKR